MPAKSAKKVLSISATALDAGGASLSKLEVTVVRDLGQAVEALNQAEYDAILLTETADESAVEGLKSALDRLPAPPLVVCPWAESLCVLRASLTAVGLPFHEIAQVSAAALLAVLEQGGASSGSQATPTQDWEMSLIGNSAAMQNVREMIRLIAPRSCTVLITGESGTGKEVVARALHEASDRSHRQMVSVNCAAIPGALLESEMFGHAKGAFTGAISHRIGRFEQAHQSTILLDEIGDTPLDLQAKILRVLQEKEIQKVGSSVSAKVDVRVVAATNRDLHLEMAEGRFRQDLFFRMRVIPLHIPPLRERAEDIPALVDHFVEKICRRERVAHKHIEETVLVHFAEQAWPGNVRELEHSIERAIALSGDREILDLGDFSPFCDVTPLRPSAQDADARAGEVIDLEQTIARLERALIAQALQRSRGNKARAAELLGLKRSTLVSKVRVHEACAQ